MAKFRGYVQGNKGRQETSAHRCGHDYVKVVAQSWEGSIGLVMFYDEDNQLSLRVYYDTESTTSPTIHVVTCKAWDFVRALRDLAEKQS